MAVDRYRDVSEMPPAPRPTRAELLRCVAAVWERAHLRLSPDPPRGVSRYRSLEAAQSARQAWSRARARRLRALADDPAARSSIGRPRNE